MMTSDRLAAMIRERDAFVQRLGDPTAIPGDGATLYGQLCAALVAMPGMRGDASLIGRATASTFDSDPLSREPELFLSPIPGRIGISTVLRNGASSAVVATEGVATIANRIRVVVARVRELNERIAHGEQRLAAKGQAVA